MKKRTKKAEPTPSEDPEINHTDEIDEEFYPSHEQAQAANEFFATPLLYYLEISKSAEEFHQRLSEIILDADKLTDDERTYLANLVAKPWAGQRGAPQKAADRQKDIWYRYHIGPQLGLVSGGTEEEAIKQIMKDYNLQRSTAERYYDDALKYEGELPPKGLKAHNPPDISEK
jgi:hypothetical protein